MKNKNKSGITLGQMKKAMLVYAQATNPQALRRVTASIIAQYKTLKEAENILVKS